MMGGNRYMKKISSSNCRSRELLPWVQSKTRTPVHTPFVTNRDNALKILTVETSREKEDRFNFYVILL